MSTSCLKDDNERKRHQEADISARKKRKTKKRQLSLTA
jgi:hypothetical protein